MKGSSKKEGKETKQTNIHKDLKRPTLTVIILPFSLIIPSSSSPPIHSDLSRCILFLPRNYDSLCENAIETNYLYFAHDITFTRNETTLYYRHYQAIAAATTLHLHIVGPKTHPAVNEICKIARQLLLLLLQRHFLTLQLFHYYASASIA